MLGLRAEEPPAVRNAPIPIHQQMEERLAVLKGDYDKGQSGIRKLEAELTSLRETKVRISGAILVLQEILSSQASGSHEHTNLTAESDASDAIGSGDQTVIHQED